MSGIMEDLSQDEALELAREEGKQRGINAAASVLQEHSPFESKDEALELALEAEEHSRQFSPFESLARDFNSAPHPDDVWDAYDEAVREGAIEKLEFAFTFK